MKNDKTKCCNCGGMGEVTVCVDCPDCTDTNQLALHDSAPNLLKALIELEKNARQAAAFIPHVLLETAITKAQRAIKDATGEK